MVSPRKSASSVNLAADEYGSGSASNRLTPSNRKSCESLYSVPSSRASASLVYRRKLPVHFGNRQPQLIPATTEVQQRVISARRLRFKNVQNQLGLAQHKITELSNELRVLRNLNKRQNSALAKYEATNAELPRLLHSHAEELRVWQTKYRSLQMAHKELEQRLKQKESVILALGDENKYYIQLNKDKNLEDRQRLAEKINSLDLRLQEKDNQMKIAERRSHLEIKNLKQQILHEQKKTKDALQKLEKTRVELSNYQKFEELNITEKLSSMSIKQQSNTKMDIKSHSRRLSTKDKPFGGGAMFNSSKTPSPAGLDASNAEDDESDFPVSHRSQKSTISSANIDYSTTRTVRKLSLSMSQKSIRGIAGQVTETNIEMIGDGPEQKKKSSDSNGKSSIMPRKSSKMMVNMPGFDGGDNSLDTEDETDGVMSETLVDGNDLDNSIDFNYAEDFDENIDDIIIDGEGDDGDGDDDENERVDPDTYVRDSASNHELELDSHEIQSYDNNESDGIKTNRSRESIGNIRKQITDDYKDREAFLDTFCRQTTGSGTRNNGGLTPKKKSNNAVQPTTNRKHKLLAALKAIDDDHCSNSQKD